MAETIELNDMTDMQRYIIEAGTTIAGSFPRNLSKEELSAWIMLEFAGRKSE